MFLEVLLKEGLFEKELDGHRCCFARAPSVTLGGYTHFGR
jgi:hypothetical protein